MIKYYLMAIGIIISLFGGLIAFGFQALFKIILIIAILYCGISFFFVPLFWDGIIRIGGVILAIKLFRSYELF